MYIALASFRNAYRTLRAISICQSCSLNYEQLNSFLTHEREFRNNVIYMASCLDFDRHSLIDGKSHEIRKKASSAVNTLFDKSQ